VTEASLFPCDLCGSDDAVEVPHAREFTGDQPIHICRVCGFVYVRQRRPSDAIAASWSDDIYGSGYTAKIPAVTARLTYVAELVDAEVGLDGARVCEIGAGEGEFLSLARDRGAADLLGVEPSKANCRLLDDAGIRSFAGTIEDFEATGSNEKFDVVAILWTLENCQDCRRMLSAARRLLRDGGHLVVATGSRILVPFKKPIQAYFSDHPADIHAFRFSAATLQGLIRISGFGIAHVNRYLDHDVLCVIGSAGEPGERGEGDDYLDVYTFFERWFVDSTVYYPSSAESRRDFGSAAAR
jgi:SAM-dependent methyltransferase